MNTEHKMVVGIFRDRLAAQQCYGLLQQRGYFDSEINLLMSEHTRSLYADAADEMQSGPQHRVVRTDTESKAASGMGIGGAIGTALGGSIAAIAAIGTSLVLPGLNLIVAGPLAAALAGGGAGAVTGGILGGLVGLGMPKAHAENYHEAIRAGHTILGVTLRDNAEETEVRQLLQSCGAENIQSA